MKKIKYIISFCIIFIGLLIIGESHIFYLDNFYTQYSNTTLYLQQGTTNAKMIADITNSSTNNNVDVFTFTRSQPNSSLSEYIIYGTPGTEKFINQKSNIFKRKYTSLFLGNINFNFDKIENIPNIKNQNEYYVIGTKENVKQFKMDLINNYAGNHPKEGYIDRESKKNTIGIWILINSIILLFSFYDVISQKKENLVRVTMGDAISKIIWKNILMDSCVFIISFVSIIFVLSKYTYIYFNIKISIILFAILLFINGALYFNLYFLNVKEVFSNNGKNSKNLLSLNYSLKLITTIITIFIISSNIAFIYQSYTFHKQKTFFENYPDYYYIKLTYKPITKNDNSMLDRWDESIAIQDTFYKEFYQEFNAISIKNVSNYSNFSAISANKNAYHYLSSKIVEFENLTLDKDFYFILPDSMKNKTKIIDELKIAINYNDGIDYDVIYYHENVNIVGIDENNIYGSDLVKNPAIIFNNMLIIDQYKNENAIKSVGFLDALNDVMYKISSNDQLNKFNTFIVKHNLKDQVIIKTNVLKNYENKWIIANRILNINLVFSFLVLLLEIIIINSIIILEYKVNAIELSIKKILGYNILEKNKKIILMSVITTLLSIIIAIIVNIIMKTQIGYYLAYGGISILILELSIITFYIKKIEKSEIQKILKGKN